MLLVRWPVLRWSPHADLDLTGSDRGCPVGFEEDVSGADPAPMDLSVSPAPLSQGVLVPAAGPVSTEQESFRREMFSAVESAFAASAAPGGVCTYEAALRVIVFKGHVQARRAGIAYGHRKRGLLVFWIGSVAGAQGHLVGLSPARCALEL